MQNPPSKSKKKLAPPPAAPASGRAKTEPDFFAAGGLIEAGIALNLWLYEKVFANDAIPPSAQWMAYRNRGAD
jgi:hypothetical protein